MHESVSDVLVARARELDGFGRPVTASFAVHVMLMATLALLPSAWFAVAAPEKPMMISLGAGATGPEKAGLTSLGGRKVDAVAPPKTRPEPIVPAQQKSTAMAEPTKAPVKPATPPKKEAAQTPTAPVTKPNVGAQVSQGNAVAATTATGLGVGLSTGGQGGMSLDSNFCCPDWVDIMRNRINWNEHIGAVGTVVITFVVERSGKITVKEMKKSGVAALDLDAQRALSYAQLPPLPAAYEPEKLTVTLTFPYIR